MVCIAIAIVTKTGRLLLSRQYMDMTRIRVEGLFAAFPKLLTGTKAKQHTYIETNEVRYVYQPLEGMYLVLITNKSSNIIEDLETLRLLSKVVPDTCAAGNMWLSEDVITNFAFELIFAIDEVVTFGGHRIQITLPQIRKNLLMESQQEIAYDEQQRMKEDDARAEMKRKAQSIREQKREAMRRNGGVEMKGFGGGFGSSNNSNDSYSGGGSDKYGFPSQSSSSDNFYPSSRRTVGEDDEEERTARKPRKMRKGLKIGKKKKNKTNSALEALAAEEGINISRSRNERPEQSSGNSNNKSRREGADSAFEDMDDCDVAISLNEKITVRCNRDGGLDALEIKGTMTVTANSKAGQLSQVRLEQGDNSNFQVQSNPHIDRKALARDSILRSKSTNRPFPLGNGVGAMRWRFSSSNDDSLPLTINCWPEAGDSKTNVSIEYALENPELKLENVVIAIPLGTSAPPQFASVSGMTRHDKREGILYWHMDVVDSDHDSGSLEFNVEGTDEDAFFPVEVNFESSETFFKVDATKAIDSEKNPIEVMCRGRLSVNSYTVG